MNNHSNQMQPMNNNDYMYQPATDNWQNQSNMQNWKNNSQNMQEWNNGQNISPQYDYVGRGLTDNVRTNVRDMNRMAASSSSTNSSFTPETVTNSDFMPAYLRQHIGQWVRVDFLIADGIEQRVGILQEVGASYIILQAIEPSTIVVCDMYSIKFVTIVLNGNYTKLFTF